MATTPVEATEAPATEKTETAPDAGDELIHKPEPEAITTTESLPKSDPAPKTDAPDGDVKPEPEPGKEPEAKAEEKPAAPTLETLAADVTNLTERNKAQEIAHQTQVTDLKTATALAEDRAKELETQTTEGQLAQRVIGFRDAAREHLKTTRDDLDTAAIEAEANRLTQTEWNRYLASQAQATSDTRVTELERDLFSARKVGSVDHLMTEHGVPEEDRHMVLATADNADAAIAIAKRLGEAAKNVVKLEELTQAKVPADDPSNSLDAGGDLATMTDEQIFKGYGAGTHSDTVAAQKAGERLGLI